MIQEVYDLSEYSLQSCASRKVPACSRPGITEKRK